MTGHLFIFNTLSQSQSFLGDKTTTIEEIICFTSQRFSILAVEQFGAGPYGSMYLADMRAEVIKIENKSSGRCGP